MKLYNTYSRSLEEFAPLEPGHVRMYTCGPTVYNYAHIGNFRAYVFEDVLRRQLKACGHKVTQVMNLTDVDDKTIRGANAEGVSLNDYTRKYKDAFFEDLGRLNIERAEHYPAATDHIPQMIELITRLLERGCAYKSDDGSIYFNVRQFPRYGCLAHFKVEDLQSGARVAQDEYDKENVADFALWKAWDEKDGQIVWDSPWGRGRPGWHIECSAMSMKYLGESFDIHTGGADNIFPHHENEIAQSEAATGATFVRYWMHCGYLVVDGAKMSKSLGNFYTLRDLLERGYTGREIRYVLLAAHYRQPVNFTFSALDAARASLARLDEFAGRLASAAAGAAPSAKIPDWAGKALGGFRDAMAEDLNMPEALGRLFDLVSQGNRALDQGALGAADAAAILERYLELDIVLGLLGREEKKPDAEAERMLEERRAARAAKNWKESDRLRDALLAIGWEVRDTAAGQTLKARRP